MLSDLSELYPVAQAKKNELDGLLEQFALHDNSIPIQQKLGALTAQYSQLADKIEKIYAKSKPRMDKTTQDVWGRRVQKLCNDASQFRTSLAKQMGHLHRCQVEAAQREGLLRGAVSTHSSQGLQREQHALLESHEMVDNSIKQGAATVKSMTYQRRALKAVRKRLLTIATSVGMSSNLVNVIERRTFVDRWLVYCLIAFSSLLFLFLYYLAKNPGSGRYTTADNVPLATADGN